MISSRPGGRCCPSGRSAARIRTRSGGRSAGGNGSCRPNMHRFHYRGRELHCEDAPVSKIAQAVGTPFYLYSIGTFLDHFLKLKKAFRPANPLICFSMKANSNLTVLNALVRHVSGLDIVS